jgi:hypothetical protein
MRRRTLLSAMLTLVAAAAAAVAMAGCGGKAGAGETTKGATTTGVHKQPSHPPAY